MNTLLKYVPIFRGRQEEIRVIQSFSFEDSIYPCLEIIKQTDRLPPTRKKKSKTPQKPSKVKTFAETYLPIIGHINARKVFVDLPIHLKPDTKRKKETTEFLSKISVMQNRITFIKYLAPLAERIIPIISSYAGITGERQTIVKQANELRSTFSVLGFRTFMKNFMQDKEQLLSCAQPTDYLIMDWEEIELDENDPDVMDIVSALSEFDCTVILHRNPFPKNLTNTRLEHDQLLREINNDHIAVFKKFGGSCFSDYVGIKKDDVGDGGIVSPGFVYYDAVNNEFYGYRYKNGSHKKGERKPELSEFETTIVPGIISSQASERMLADPHNYLDSFNEGWVSLNKIKTREMSGQNQALFKRIGMQHYMHCMKAKIKYGDFS